MIRIENLCIELSGFAVQDVDLCVKEGEFFTLIGPTGSGKTLVLESVAGLAPKCTGRILVNRQDVTRMPPERRAVSLVYQDHSLFPHLTVMQNVTYGQRYQGIEKGEGELDAIRLLDQLGLARVANRKPEKLSGGEKQRVSIARALACRPNVLLLDEPLSSLDPQFRAGLRQTLKSLHKETGLTVLMVTHDFVDALTLSDRAAVIRGGRIEQVGAVADIFRQPATPFVAEFVGMTNVLPATFDKGACAFAGHQVVLDTIPEWRCGFAALRPEDISVSLANDFPEDWCVIKGVVNRVDREGFSWLAQVDCGGQMVMATVNQLLALDGGFGEGSIVFLGFARSHLHLMPPEHGGGVEPFELAV